VEVVNVRVVASRGGTGVKLVVTGEAVKETQGRERVEWALLCPGTLLRGPMMVDGMDATARIEGGWSGTVQQSGAILLERT